MEMEIKTAFSLFLKDQKDNQISHQPDQYDEPHIEHRSRPTIFGYQDPPWYER